MSCNVRPAFQQRKDHINFETDLGSVLEIDTLHLAVGILKETNHWVIALLGGGRSWTSRRRNQMLLGSYPKDRSRLSSGWASNDCLAVFFHFIKNGA